MHAVWLIYDPFKIKAWNLMEKQSPCFTPVFPLLLFYSGQQQWPCVFSKGSVPVHSSRLPNRWRPQGRSAVLGWCRQPASGDSVLQRKPGSGYPEESYRRHPLLFFRIPHIYSNMGPHRHLAKCHFFWWEPSYSGKNKAYLKSHRMVAQPSFQRCQISKMPNFKRSRKKVN